MFNIILLNRIFIQNTFVHTMFSLLCIIRYVPRSDDHAHFTFSKSGLVMMDYDVKRHHF